MPTSTPSLLVVRDGPAHVVKLRNPARANALDAAMFDGLIAELQPDALAGARCVLVSGDGDRHFSAGLDLGDLTGDALAAHIRAGEQHLGRAAAAIEQCPLPVIAVVNGAAFGGALELATACDWRIAGDGVLLGMPAARLGVVYSATGLARFVALMGPARARQMFLTGRPVDAARAFQIGLVDEVVPADDLWRRAAETAADIARAAPGAVAGTRAVIAALHAGLRDDTRRVADGVRERAFGSADFREALAAMREKRAPRWHDGS